MVGEAPRPADPGLVAVAGAAPGPLGAGPPLEGWAMMGGWFWPLVAVIGLLCLLSIRGSLRRLVRRLDSALRLSEPSQGASQRAEPPGPRSGKP